MTRSSAMRETTLDEAIEIVKQRRFRAVAKVKSLSWEDLGLTKPSVSLEDQAEIGGISLEDIKKLRGVVDAKEPEEEKKEEAPVVEESKDAQTEETPAVEESKDTPPELTLKCD